MLGWTDMERDFFQLPNGHCFTYVGNDGGLVSLQLKQLPESDQVIAGPSVSLSQLHPLA